MPTAEKIAELREVIRQHDKLYYVYGEPIVSDTDYDKIFKQLQELEAAHPHLVTDDSPTQRVGGEPVGGLVTTEHLTPMMSIDNGFNLAVLDKFNERVTKALGYEPKYALDWKIDGCAISLIYEDGVLVRAVTRGDGKSGDVITHNARVIRGVPLDIRRIALPGVSTQGDIPLVQGVVEIRGEAYIPNSVFAKVVERQIAAGAEPFKNSRNATAGALRQLDPTACARRCLHFVAHGLGKFDPTPIKGAWWATMAGLYTLGVPIIDGGQGGLSYEDVKTNLTAMTKQVTEIDYPVDGIVLKLDQFADREALGQSSSRHVSWALAYKWERYEAETTIVKLETQVGKQGTLTPVAYYEPVVIAETMVQKSTLFNFDEVERLDPRVGDIVTLEKAGKIIPHLVRVHKDKRTGKPRIFRPPTECPKCGAPTARDGPLVYCTNTADCPAQLAAVIESAADRTRLDIDGLGPKAISSMIKAGAITDFASLWALKDDVDAAGCIPGMTAGKSKKLLAALEAAKARPSWRLLASLNIKHCGRTNSELICRAIQAAQTSHSDDVFAVLQKKWHMNNLIGIEGVGEETATSIISWFESDPNRRLLTKLRDVGLNMGSSDPQPDTAPTGPQPFVGMSICATGKLVGFTRDGIKQAIVQRGGKASSSVSKNTDLLIAGADAGSKLEKAASLGIRVVDEAEFKQLAGIA